jgi:hypothetical protein
VSSRKDGIYRALVFEPEKYKVKLVIDKASIALALSFMRKLMPDSRVLFQPIY